LGEAVAFNPQRGASSNEEQAVARYATGDKGITHDPAGRSYDEGFALRFNK
jgi:hypothetical protein